jgi:hypothetical protein
LARPTQLLRQASDRARSKVIITKKKENDHEFSNYIARAILTKIGKKIVIAIFESDASFPK